MPPVKILEDQHNLVNTAEFPSYAKFPFSTFNPVQSRVVEVHDKDANVIIAAATSAGKTVCAEMIASHEVRTHGGKVVYLAPLKALAQEKIDDWTDVKHHFGDLKLSICTGDYQLTPARKKELESANIIIMTTEMLNARVRNFKSEQNNWLKDTGVIICDESHLLTVPGRGDHLEVGLMKFSEIAPNSRIVFLSATMPNVQELAEWVAYSLTQKETYLINSKFRPCPLGIHYETYYDKGSYDEKEMSKINSAIQIMRDHPDDKFLVFVHTKRTGQLVKKSLVEMGINCEYHNADLSKDNRLKIEKSFREDKNLRAIVATSTLAWGCYEKNEFLLGDNAKLIKVSDVHEGSVLLCPVDDKYVPKKVLKTRCFKSEVGYSVQLETGEEMTVSEDHIFYSAKKRESPEWNCVSELSIGDFVAVPSDLKLWNTREYNRFWYLLGYAFGDGCLCRCGQHADGGEKVVLDMCLGEYGEFANLFCYIFKEEFPGLYKIRKDSNGVPHLVTKKREIVDKFLSFLPLGRKDGETKLPNDIYGKTDRICSFLMGWFDADGGMEDHSNGNVSVGLSCISSIAIKQARVLLLGFGIRSSFGKKRVKDTIINGRLQKARRDWSYRLRIFGLENINKFNKCIGFLHPDKTERLSEYLKVVKNNSKDLVPARDLIKEHLIANGIGTNVDFFKITNTDLWNSLHTQDCKRLTLKKLIDSTDVRSNLNVLLEKPVYWSRIKRLNKCDGGEFKEIEVESPHAYVGSGAISHNCNFPARRVIILGVHRGLDLVESYDIWQMAGRAGRVGLDPRGDVYVLLPESEDEVHHARISKPRNIESTLLTYVGDEDNRRYKTLAFHLVSEIHHGGIKTRDDVNKWYEKSLAHWQANDLEDEIVDSTIDLLLKCGAIFKENDEYKCSTIGIISSMFYYSPFDVADLRRNFKILFEGNLQDNDIFVSLALGNTDTFKGGIVSRLEREEMSAFATKVGQYVKSNPMKEPAIKTAYAYFTLLRGMNPQVFAGLARNLQFDFPRTNAVLQAIDSMVGKWGKRDWLKTLQLRMTYGVRAELVDFCRIPNIGKVRAEKLWRSGFRDLHDVGQDVDKVAKSLGYKKEKAEEISAEARKLALVL
jgi:replicative superfamily II helicase